MRTELVTFWVKSFTAVVEKSYTFINSVVIQLKILKLSFKVILIILSFVGFDIFVILFFGLDRPLPECSRH